MKCLCMCVRRTLNAAAAVCVSVRQADRQLLLPRNLSVTFGCSLSDISALAETRSMSYFRVKGKLCEATTSF